ncbi:hypothetical protein AVEN_8228-1 [Araneus ventricosus]|uniref:Uncharacterized protein n=1 Tax=Araneus ventricosus TaxID=182803 RepID=A0A4Y2AY02_ARAVE|nr:hypothetical protein AVEN_8228-1 [Araneus ventricosus]
MGGKNQCSDKWMEWSTDELPALDRSFGSAPRHANPPTTGHSDPLLLLQLPRPTMHPKRLPHVSTPPIPRLWPDNPNGVE